MEESCTRERLHKAFAVAHFDARAHIVLTRCRSPRGRSQVWRRPAQRFVVRSQHRGDRRPQEQHRADERRNRIAGQAEQRRLAKPAEDQRLARPHRDFPEVELEALRSERLLNQIMIADRCAAQRDDQIGVLGRDRRCLRRLPTCRAGCRDRSASPPQRSIIAASP